jgi:hypothetical protein
MFFFFVKLKQLVLFLLKKFFKEIKLQEQEVVFL